MSTSIYTSYIGTPALGANAKVQVVRAADLFEVVPRGNAGVLEVGSGNYRFFGSIDDSLFGDGVFIGLWDENDGIAAVMDLVGGLRVISSETPSPSSGGTRIIFGPPGTVVIEQ